MVTEEIFKDLYFNKQHSLRMIGAKFGMNHGSLIYFAKKKNIKIRTKSESIELAYKTKRRDVNGRLNPNYIDGKQIGVSVGNRWAKYGMSKDEFETMREIQNNKCAICNDEFIITPHIDHCHDSGKVRGLLCSFCNQGIGQFDDDIEILKKAIIYLNKARW